MSASSLKTLVHAIASAAVIVNVNVSFGGELIAGLDRVPPLVDIVPVGGEWVANGYAQGVDQDVQIWMTHEQTDFYCYGVSLDPQATPVDHYDAARAVSNLVMQAINAQAATGLRVYPLSGMWVTAQNELSQYGRAYKLVANVDISMLDVLPVDAPTPITTTITPAIVHGS